MVMRVIKDFSPCIRTKMEVQDGDEQMEIDEASDSVSFESKAQFINFIESEFDLMETFFDNFRTYLLKVKAIVRTKKQQDPSLDVNSLKNSILSE
jgi:hypothetical protein